MRYELRLRDTEGLARIGGADIFDGLEKGEEHILADPASLSIAEGWRSDVSKALERQFAAFMPQSAVGVA